MSLEAEQIKAAHDLYRRHERTERRDEAYGLLRDVVDAVKARHLAEMERAATERPTTAGKDYR